MNLVMRNSAAVMVALLCLMFGFVGSAYAADDALQAGEIAASHADGWEQADSAWHYWRDGEMVKGTWIVTSEAPGIEGATTASEYWIDNDGALAVGRVVDPSTTLDAGAGTFCVYVKKDASIATGKTVVGDHVYLARSNGRLESGNAQGFLSTKKYDSKKRRYYIDPTEHAAITGKAVKVAGFGYTYSLPNKGYLLTGVKKVDSTHVLVASKTGLLCQKKGWVTTKKYAGKKTRYYFEKTTVSDDLIGARIGLFKKSGKKYYGLKKTGGVAVSTWQKIGKTYYHANKKGVLSKSKVISRMIKKAQKYSSPSKYLIMVDTDDTKLIVFTGKKKNWKVKYVWDCSTGAPSTPTPIGVYHVGIKGPSFGHGYTCYYYTQFYGDYLFHTRIYKEGTHILQDAAMNTMVSQGCVRLLDKNAYWIYKHIPQGTTVVTIK